MTQQLISSLIPDALCVVVCLIAVVTDMKTRKIPNRLTVTAALTGVTVNTVLPMLNNDVWHGIKNGLLMSLFGALFLFSVFFAFGAIRAMGMGDVKLMFAVGAFVRWPLAFRTLANVLLSGVLISLLYIVVTGKAREVFKNMRHAYARPGREKSQQQQPVALHYMPYAWAVLTGVILSLLHRYGLLTLWG